MIAKRCTRLARDRLILNDLRIEVGGSNPVVPKVPVVVVKVNGGRKSAL